MILDENVAVSSQKIIQEVEAVEEEIHQVVEKGVGKKIRQVVGIEEQAVRKLQPILENVIQNETGQDSEMRVIHDDEEEQDIPSDTEDSVPSEIFELKWTSPSNVGQNLEMYESSSLSGDEEDDDDNLIEINLPGSESNGLDEDPDQNLQTKLPDIFPNSILRQHGFRELLAEINEMNEEENLIEIDISMGSIKCSRLEIEA